MKNAKMILNEQIVNCGVSCTESSKLGCRTEKQLQDLYMLDFDYCVIYFWANDCG